MYLCVFVHAHTHTQTHTHTHTHTGRQAHTSVRECTSIPGCSEPCALVLLNSAVTGSLFPAAAHHRPRPSYVTVTLNTHTHLIFSF